MGNALVTIPEGDVDVQRRIRTVRGVQVILDRDLALLYEVETGQLNRHVKRNMDRFPSDFMFQLTKDDVENLKCQFGISSWGGDRAMQARQKALSRRGRADVQRAVQELALCQGVRAIPRPLFHHRPQDARPHRGLAQLLRQKVLRLFDLRPHRHPRNAGQVADVVRGKTAAGDNGSSRNRKRGTRMTTHETRTSRNTARRSRPAAQIACTSLADYVARQCSTRQRTEAFLRRIGVRKTPSGGLYVVPV